MQVIRKENKNLGLKLLDGFPVGGNNATENQVEEWLAQRLKLPIFGRPFHSYSDHFQLDWKDVDIQHPLYLRRDLDLCLIAFPEVQSPYKFADYIFIRDTEAKSNDNPELDEWSKEEFIIKPPIYDYDLNLINTDVKIRKLLDNKHRGIRIYSENSPAGQIPLKATRHGKDMNLPALIEDLNQKMMVAPKSWMQEASENTIYSPDSDEFLKHIGITLANHLYDDDLWEWYSWDDGDIYRKIWEDSFQKKYIPRRGSGYNLLLKNVLGMTQGGNGGKIWIDPVYLSALSLVNHHRLFREVSHCYTMACNFCSSNNRQVGLNHVNDIYGGFTSNVYAGHDGHNTYCRYRQERPEALWQSRENINTLWDRNCKYQGIPRRALEYDKNYSMLINEILINFRKEGIFYWKKNQYIDKFVQTSNAKGYTLNSNDVINNWNFGQFLYQSGGTILGAQKIFWYTNPAPTFNRNSNPEEYDQILEEHKLSRVFARIYYWNDIENEVNEWVVELLDNYISPYTRVSQYEIVDDFTGGEEPFVKDKKFAGRNNGGYRPKMTKTENGLWKIEFPHDINPDGFYNIDGGKVMLTGTSGDILGEIYESMLGISGRPAPVYVDVPSVLSRGAIQAWGLPGEVIKRDVVAWKPPVVIKWNHIQEIYDRLFDPSIDAGDEISFMEKSINEGKIIVNDKIWPNHILAGKIVNNGISKEVGRGMVSNGDTEFSDLLLLSDMLHARNLALPMLSFKLNPGIPNDTAEDFEEEVTDFTTRTQEPRHLSIQRIGFREPGAYTFMANFKKGAKLTDDASYVLWVPSWIGSWPGAIEDGDAPNSLNRIFRVFHPNGMRWWRDNGLLGCGIQFGENPTELGSYGDGLTQRGRVIFNLFRRNCPPDKEVVAAYLRLIPSTANYIGSSEVSTAGGGRQTTSSNTPFINVDVVSEEFKNLEEKIRSIGSVVGIEYEKRLYWKEEHQGTLDGFDYNEMEAFQEVYDNLQDVIGDFDFPFRGGVDQAGIVGKPVGMSDDSFFLWSRLDPAKTRDAYVLKAQVAVYGGKNGRSKTFETSLRGLPWYEHIWPGLLSGRHSYSSYVGLNSRKDYDEKLHQEGFENDGIIAEEDKEQTSVGLGFACSSGGWAKDHRIFDITSIVRDAYIQDRFTAKYNIVVNKKIENLLYYSLISTLAPLDGALEAIPLTKRVLGYSGILDTNLEDVLNGQDRSLNSFDANGYFSLWLDLKQKIPTKATTNIYGESINTATEISLRKNILLKDIYIKLNTGEISNQFIQILVRSRSFDGTIHAGWYVLYAARYDNEENEIIINSDYLPENSQLNIHQISEIKIVGKFAELKMLKVTGYVVEDYPDFVPITSPPISEIHNLDHAIQDPVKNSNSPIFAYTFLPIAEVVSKVYEVIILASSTSYLSMFSNAIELPGSIKLSYDGQFNPVKPPVYEWVKEEETWRIKNGTYQYDPISNAVVLPTSYLYEVKEEQYSYIDENGIVVYRKRNVNNILANLVGLQCSIRYVSGRGALVKCLIQAEKPGPSYDIDPEAINRISEDTVNFLPDTSSISPIFYGDTMLPYTVYNPQELQGGYVRGTMPENGHVDFSQFFEGDNNGAWKTYCRGIVHIHGEPNVVIPDNIIVEAPDYIISTDPVTGKSLANGFLNNSFDRYKIPNGGRKPANIIVDLEPLNQQSPHDDNSFVKKQVAFVPELLIFLRERTNVYRGSDNFGLVFE